MLAPPSRVAAPNRPNNCSVRVSPVVRGTINDVTRMFDGTVGIIIEAPIGVPLCNTCEETNSEDVKAKP